MLKRLAGLVVTVAGVVFALLIGFWALVFLGAVAIVAALVYAVRSRFMNGGRRSEGRVVEGEFVVLPDDREHTRDEGGDAR